MMKTMKKLNQKIEQLSEKHIRMLLGIMMMYGFIFLVQAFYFFTKIAVQYDNFIEVFLWAMMFYSGFWMPSILLIIVTYIVLTRVYPYDSKQ